LARYPGALAEITKIVAIALTLGGGSLLQSAVGFAFGLFVVPLLLLITDLAIFNTNKTASAVDDRNSFSLLESIPQVLRC